MSLQSYIFSFIYKRTMFRKFCFVIKEASLGIEPKSKEPESFILSVELRSQIQLKVENWKLKVVLSGQLIAISYQQSINYQCCAKIAFFQLGMRFFWDSGFGIRELGFPVPCSHFPVPRSPFPLFNTIFHFPYNDCQYFYNPWTIIQ